MNLNPFAWLRQRKLKRMHDRYEQRRKADAARERLLREKRALLAKLEKEREASRPSAPPAPEPVIPMHYTHDSHVPEMLMTPMELGQRVEAGESWKVVDGGTFDGAGASGDWESASESCSSSDSSSSDSSDSGSSCDP